MKVGVVVNPTAGKGHAARWHQPVLDELHRCGIEVDDLSANTAEQAQADAVRAVSGGSIDALIVVGGDGMVHLGVNACAGTAVPLGIVAAGTGNDSAATHDLPRDPVLATRSAVQALQAAEYRELDAAMVRTADGVKHWFLAVLSLGFDAVVAERANRMRWPTGPARYNVAVALQLPLFRPPTYHLRLDDEPLSTRAMLVSVANGSTFGGGMKIAPDAASDDGLLDVVLLRPVPILEFVKVFPSVFKGTHVLHPQVSIRRARRIEVSVDRPLIAYADGERLGPTPLTCEVVPAALRLLASPTPR